MRPRLIRVILAVCLVTDCMMTAEFVELPTAARAVASPFGSQAIIPELAACLTPGQDPSHPHSPFIQIVRSVQAVEHKEEDAPPKPQPTHHPEVVRWRVGTNLTQTEAVAVVATLLQMGPIQTLAIPMKTSWMNGVFSGGWVVDKQSPQKANREATKFIRDFAARYGKTARLTIVISWHRINAEGRSPDHLLVFQRAFLDGQVALELVPEEWFIDFDGIPQIWPMALTDPKFWYPVLGTSLESRLTELQRNHLDLFLRESAVDAERFSLRSIFIAVMLEEISPAEALTAMIYAGVPETEARRLFVQFLATGKDDEVVDSRPELTLADRARMLRSRETLLSDKGKKYLQALEEALISGDTQRIQNAAREFPTVQNPHLDYFVKSNVTSELLREFPSTIATFKITAGCSHPCQHCFFDPDYREVRAVPFNRILEFLQAANSISDKQVIDPEGISLHYDNEIFDYYDPIYDADIGDVIAAFLETMPKVTLNFTTRGWYLGNRIAPRGMAKIQKLMEAYPGRLDVIVSVDLYDVRTDIPRYVVRAVQLLEHFDAISIRVNDVASLANVDATRHMRYLVRLLTRQFNIIFEDGMPIGRLSAFGRGAKQAVPNQPGKDNDVGDCLYGIHLWPDGRVRIKRKLENPTSLLVHEFSDLGVLLWGPEEPIDVRAPKSKSKRNYRSLLDLTDIVIGKAAAFAPRSSAPSAMRSSG